MSFGGVSSIDVLLLGLTLAGFFILRASSLRREAGMLFALGVLIAILFTSNTDFLGQSNILNTTRQVAMLSIFAIGTAFVIITGGIDLSIGSIIGLTGVIIAKVSSTEAGCMGQPIWIGILVALGVALLIGLIQGLLITQLDLQPFIVTLGFMLALRGVSQTIVSGGTLSFGDAAFRNLADQSLFPPPETLPHFVFRDLLTPHGLAYFGQNVLAIITAYPTMICLGTVLVAAYVLHFTVFGRYVYAIGGNRDAAAYSGINVKRVETITYVISAGSAGVAGICYAAYIGQMSQQVGIAYELYAIAAAVLGGCSLRGGEGTVLGVLIGSAMMRIIDNGIIMYQWPPNWLKLKRPIWRLDTNWTFIIIGAVILVAVILDQIVHLLQNKRRTRMAGASAPPPPAEKPIAASSAPS